MKEKITSFVTFVFIFNSLVKFMENCPDNTWTVYNQHCYKLIKQTKNWQESGQHCDTQFSGHLVRIDDATENTFVANLVSSDLSNSIPTWISANDLATGIFIHKYRNVFLKMSPISVKIRKSICS